MPKQVAGRATPAQIKALWALIQATNTDMAYTALGMLTPAEATAMITTLKGK